GSMTYLAEETVAIVYISKPTHSWENSFLAADCRDRSAYRRSTLAGSLALTFTGPFFNAEAAVARCRAVEKSAVTAASVPRMMCRVIALAARSPSRANR